MPADDVPEVLQPFRALASLALGAGVAALWLWRAESAAWIGPSLGACVAIVVYLVWVRRDLRRRRLAREPFPPAWRAILEEWVEFYRRLEEPERRRFEREVRFFLVEQTITGPRGAALDDEIRTLVAASAVVVVFGRRGYRYPRLRDIVVYEEAFDDEYAVGAGGDILGMVHGQGPILFSARSLRQGFRGDRDGRNVGYHEFAHVLDFESGHADGIPGFMPWGAVSPWLKVMHEETAKLEKRRHLLRQYAAKNEAEFFAVATEVFFEKPEQLKAKHPELYALLAEAYGHEPPSERAREPAEGS